MFFDTLFAFALAIVAIAASPYGASERERLVVVIGGALLMGVCIFAGWRSPELDSSGGVSDTAPSARRVTNPCEGMVAKDGVDACVVNAAEIFSYDSELRLTKPDASGPLRPRPEPQHGHIVMCRDGALWCLAD